MTSPGVTGLSELIQSMDPLLDDQTYLFVNFGSLTSDAAALFAEPAAQEGIRMVFREDEGWTGIVRQDFAAAQGLPGVFACRRITLHVYSSLEAVGFLAAVTARLALLDVGVNPVSALLHDHLFVPDGVEDKVLVALQQMAVEEREKGKGGVNSSSNSDFQAP